MNPKRLLKRLFPAPLLSLTVFVFWMLMVDDFGPGQWLMGALLGVVIPLFATRLDREFGRIGSLRKVPRMLGVLAWDVVRSNLVVARQVLGSESRITPGFIWVPLDIANIHGIAVLTSIITLTPGTVSSALSDDRKYLLVHVFNLKDADEVIRQIKTRYEAPLMEIFP